MSPIAGTILSSSFKDEAGSWVKQNQPVLRVGDKTGTWEVELKIPEKHVGQVLQAFEYTNSKELDVDLILRSSPTKTYRGKLAKADVGGEASPTATKTTKAIPWSSPTCEPKATISMPAYRLPKTEELLVAGTEVVAKVRCGNHRMGYSLFYGVWEFIYEKDHLLLLRFANFQSRSAGSRY